MFLINVFVFRPFFSVFYARASVNKTIRRPNYNHYCRRAIIRTFAFLYVVGSITCVAYKSRVLYFDRLEMNVKKKIIPLICLMSAYVHWIKPRLLSASASKGGKTLLLHLCARSRFLIPMIVFTAFWMFDAQMQIEASISLSLNRNVRIIVGTDGEQRRGDRALEDNDDDAPDDDDSYSIDSYSDVSAASELSVEYDNISTAIQEFVENDVTTERFTFGGTYSYQQQ